MPTISMLPSVNDLRQPLILTMGEMTGFKLGELVRYKDLIVPTMQRAGVDLKQIENMDDVWNRLYSCIYRASRIKEPLTRTQKGSFGCWALTDEGLALAIEFSKEGSQRKKNITTQFLECRIKATGGINGTLWNLFRMTLKAHLTISDTTDRIEDHLQTAMYRLMHRDALRDRILSGMTIEDTQLSSYILRSAFNDCRDEGTEPTSREMYGALTDKERSSGTKRGPISDSRVIWAKDSDRWDASSISEIWDADGSYTQEATIDQIYFDECWGKIEAIVKAKKPHAWERYINILKMKAEGARVKDIAEAEKVSPNRAASIISEARRVIREASDENLLGFI